jgi:hypothetical protein
MTAISIDHFCARSGCGKSIASRSIFSTRVVVTAVFDGDHGPYCSDDCATMAEVDRFGKTIAADIVKAATGGCGHTRTKRGENVPLRWGSARSEVCVDCGAFRTHSHTDPTRWLSEWKPAARYAEAIKPSEDV